MTAKLITFRKSDMGHSSANANAPAETSGEWLFTPVQQTLFPLRKTLIIVSLSEEIGARLSSLIQQTNPAYIFDSRSVPRFDFGNSNRSQAFAQFERARAKYIDLANIPYSRWRSQLVDKIASENERPTMIFVTERAGELESQIVKLIGDHLDWSIHKISNETPVARAK